MSEMTRAHHLEGTTLPGGWALTEKYEKKHGDTGGQFSVQYRAERDGKEFFVKIIDIEKALRQADLEKWTATIQEQTAAFDYERNLLEKCRDRSLSKIVRVLDANMIPVQEDNPYPIPFLVFEKADGNVKDYIAFQDKVDFAWKLKSLHDIATGIQQLHSIQVIHQDLKPSNILQFKEQSKIADLGRSKTFSGTGLYDKKPFSGDMTYAPLEIYSEFAFLRPENWLDRNLAMDSYELGNLMTFYFTGLNMTAILIRKLQAIGITKCGTEQEMRSYIEICYDKCIEDVKEAIEYEDFKEPISQMIRELCNPDPNKRNDEKTLRERGSHYVLHRYITRLNVLQKQAELILVKNGTLHR